MNDGADASAIRALRQLLQEAPRDTRTRLKLADLLTRNGQTAEAIEHYTACAQEFAAQGGWLKAIALHNQILRMQPGHEPAQRALAELYVNAGLPDDASQQFCQLAARMLTQERGEEAVQLLKHALTLLPDHVSLQVALAEAYVSTNALRLALALLSVVAERLRQEAQWELLVEVLHRMLFVGGEDDELMRALAEAYLKQRRPALAWSVMALSHARGRLDDRGLMLMAEAFGKLVAGPAGNGDQER